MQQSRDRQSEHDWRVCHVRDHEIDDWIDDARDARLAALEEIVSARWPRSVLVRIRLRRQLRQNDRQYAWADDGFAGRQATAMSDRAFEGGGYRA